MVISINLTGVREHKQSCNVNWIFGTIYQIIQGEVLIVATFMLNNTINSRSDCEFVNVEDKFVSNPSMNGKLQILTFHPRSVFLYSRKSQSSILEGERLWRTEEQQLEAEAGITEAGAHISEDLFKILISFIINPSFLNQDFTTLSIFRAKQMLIHSQQPPYHL